MKRKFKGLIGTVIDAITALIVHIGVSREINEDGSWDQYHERRNRKEVKR